MTKTEFENQYTRKQVLSFLSQNGLREKTEEEIIKISKQIDEKLIKCIAMGLPIEAINLVRVKKPTMYFVTVLLSIFLFVGGIVLLFIDPYISYINISSYVYIVWCLCCLSMICTSIVALGEWKKRHGQKK